MSSRLVVIDDATEQEIPKGTTYYNLIIKYYENDLQYQTAAPKQMIKDAQNWGDVVNYLGNGIPATTVELTIVKRTA